MSLDRMPRSTGDFEDPFQAMDSLGVSMAAYKASRSLSRESMVARWVDAAVPSNSDRVNLSSSSQGDESREVAEHAECRELGWARRRTCTCLECNVRSWRPVKAEERIVFFTLELSQL